MQTFKFTIDTQPEGQLLNDGSVIIWWSIVERVFVTVTAKLQWHDFAEAEPGPGAFGLVTELLIDATHEGTTPRGTWEIRGANVQKGGTVTGPCVTELGLAPGDYEIILDLRSDDGVDGATQSVPGDGGA